MSPRQAVAALLLCALAAAAGARRLWPPSPPARVARCLHPCGARIDGVLRVLCPTSPPAAGACEPLPAATRLVLGLPLPLNRATAADLDELPRVGKTLARRIVEERERRGGFRRIEELRAVRGIGAATLRRLRPWLTLD
jgi:competence ComEA-like helix-hairpin-helix protein